MKSLVLAIMIASPACATTQDDIVRASLLPGWVTADGTHMTALQLMLAPGWKTYWRSPGDAGIPPHFDWGASQNVADVRYHWPAPDVFDVNGLRSIGYHDLLILPIEISPQDVGRAVSLRGRIEFGVCKDVCVPATVDVAAMLALDGAPNPTIKQALRDGPVTGEVADLAAISCSVAPIADGLRVTATLSLPPQGGAEAVVLEPGLPGVWVSQSEVSRDGATLTAVAEMVGPSGAPFALNRSALTLTVIGTRQTVEITGCPSP